MTNDHPRAPSKARLFYEENNLLKTTHVTGNSFGGGWHFHPEYELVLNTKSYGTFLIGDQVGNYFENDLYLFGPNVPHTFICDNSYPISEAECLVLHFKEEVFSDSFIDQPEFKTLKQLLKKSRSGICFSRITGNEIRPLFDKLMVAKGIERFSLILKILDICSRKKDYSIANSEEFASGYIEPGNKRMQEVIKYIEANYHAKIKLSQVASLANMQTNAFCRYFKQKTSLSLFEFINRIRIGNACKLLLRKETSIQEISFKTGYNSASHFIHQFRKRTGMSPKEYRAFFRNKLELQSKRDSL